MVGVLLVLCLVCIKCGFENAEQAVCNDLGAQTCLYHGPEVN